MRKWLELSNRFDWEWMVRDTKHQKGLIFKGERERERFE